MLDLKRTLELVRGALLDAEATWQEYLAEAADWRRTAALLTGPVIVAAALLGYLIGIAGGDPAMPGLRPTIASTIAAIVSGAIGAVVAAFVVSTLAGLFGGRNDFALGFAATSLAFVPGYLGRAFVWLPGIGWLIALAMTVWSLVLLWRIIPLYLAVPEEKRSGHYGLTLVGTVVVMLAVSLLLRPIIGPAMPQLGN